MGYTPCPHPEKTGFPSRYRAEVILRRAARRGHRYGSPPERAYLCACGLWHLTSQPLR